MSSSALVLASLAERKQLATRHGREAFAVLLFRDGSVIPLLALLPLLSDSGTHAAGGWMAAVKGLSVIAVVIISSRIVVRPVLKAVASYGGREVFTAAALLLVVGAALIMEKLGLSPSLGAFLAGVLLADSEFRHELEADIEPFKGLLLGLFFIAVGMSANLGLVWERPLAVLGLAFGLMLAKLALMYAIARIGGAPNDTAQRLAVSISQGGEFAFILFVAAGSLGVFEAGTAQLLVVVVTVSMLLAPLAFEAHERALARNRVHLFRLRDLGVKLIWRETFPTSLDMARHALLSLGFGIAASERAVTLFKQHDEQRLDAQYAVQHDEGQLIQTSKEAAAQLQELFESDGLQPLSGFPRAGA